MLVLQRLVGLTEQQLRQLEHNAKDRLENAHDEAQLVLDSVADERRRRADVQASAARERQEAIHMQMEGRSLRERVIAAFSEMPPVEWEIAALKTLAAHPGASTESLSRALGYDGTYMN